jgi:hypothetical protein
VKSLTLDFAGGTASRLNEGTLRYAYRFVFSSQSFDELLAQAIRLRGSGPKVHVQRIKLSDSLIIRSEYS